MYTTEWIPENIIFLKNWKFLTVKQQFSASLKRWNRKVPKTFCPQTAFCIIDFANPNSGVQDILLNPWYYGQVKQITVAGLELFLFIFWEKKNWN